MVARCSKLDSPSNPESETLAMLLEGRMNEFGGSWLIITFWGIFEFIAFEFIELGIIEFEFWLEFWFKVLLGLFGCWNCDISLGGGVGVGAHSRC